MRKPPKPQDGYNVGYGRPPKHTQFRPGQSGNPKGRPKRDKSLTSLLAAILSETMSIVENGKERRVSRLEALARTIAARAIKGDVKAMGTLLSLVSPSKELQEQVTKTIIEWEFVNPPDRKTKC